MSIDSVVQHARRREVDITVDVDYGGPVSEWEAILAHTKSALNLFPADGPSGEDVTFLANESGLPSDWITLARDAARPATELGISVLTR